LRSRKAEKEPLDSSFEIGIYFSKQENEEVRMVVIATKTIK